MMGLIMPNMKIPLDEGFSFDIKLKWLTQSRNAPPNAQRCRTCALAASKAEKAYFCPLKLASESEEERREAIKNILFTREKDDSESPWRLWHRDVVLLQLYHWDDSVAHRLESFFSNEGRHLILKLKKYQDEWDQTGVLTAGIDEDADLDLTMAMTLRDCTLFMKIPKDQNKPIEARLGDLDVKRREKIPEWRMKELKLIHGGWYTYESPTRQNCLLSPKHPEVKAEEHSEVKAEEHPGVKVEERAEIRAEDNVEVKAEDKVKIKIEEP